MNKNWKDLTIEEVFSIIMEKIKKLFSVYNQKALEKENMLLDKQLEEITTQTQRDNLKELEVFERKVIGRTTEQEQEQLEFNMFEKEVDAIAKKHFSNQNQKKIALEPKRLSDLERQRQSKRRYNNARKAAYFRKESYIL